MKKTPAPTPTTAPIDELFYDHNLSIRGIIWIDSQSAHFCDALTELLEDDPHGAIVLLGLSAEALESEGHDLHDLTTPAAIDSIQQDIARRRTSGFLVEAEMAMPHNFAKDRKSWSVGWGYRQRSWFHTQALDRAFVERLIAWRDKIADKQYAEEHGPKPKKANR